MSRALLPVLALFLLSGEWLLQSTKASRILFLIPLTSLSEKQLYVPLIDELSLRGHDVTVISITNNKYKSKTIKEYVPITWADFAGDVWADPLENRKHLGRYASLSFADYGWMVDACEKVWQSPDLLRIVTQEKFDLVFGNAFFGGCVTGALHKIGAPFILVLTCMPTADPWELTGARLPMSFVPFSMGPTRPSGKFSFLDRLENVLLDLHYSWLVSQRMRPAFEEVYRKYLGNDIPPQAEIIKDVSLIFSNSHFALNEPAPALPDVIEVGGMHCGPAKPLPKDLDTFLSGAKDGFVYFSMGSIFNSKFFPQKMQREILAAFSKLKQRVLWKFEADIKDLPPNVMVGKWVPQYDILAHPNIRLFITHGGGLSTQEAIYNGVPLVSIPIGGDQNTNAYKAEQKGFAVFLEVLELTEVTLSAAMNKVLSNPNYAKNAKAISQRFRDQPQTPLERAVFWSEYVIRHNGTVHLQSSARQLNFVEYYLLDVIALLVTLVLTLLFVVYKSIKCSYRMIFGQSQKAVKKGDSKKRQ